MWYIIVFMIAVLLSFVNTKQIIKVKDNLFTEVLYISFEVGKLFLAVLLLSLPFNTLFDIHNRDYLLVFVVSYLFACSFEVTDKIESKDILLPLAGAIIVLTEPYVWLTSLFLAGIFIVGTKHKKIAKYSLFLPLIIFVIAADEQETYLSVEVIWILLSLCITNEIIIYLLKDDIKNIK